MSDLREACPGASGAQCAVCQRSTMLRRVEGDGVVPLCSVECEHDWLFEHYRERAEKAEEEAARFHERAEKAEARVVAVEAALGLQADYLALFQTRAEELHTAQARVLELEAAMKIDAEANAGIGLAVAEYQERAEKAEARVRELEEREATAYWRQRCEEADERMRSMMDIQVVAYAFAIFGAWSTEPWR